MFPNIGISSFSYLLKNIITPLPVVGKVLLQIIGKEEKPQNKKDYKKLN